MIIIGHYVAEIISMIVFHNNNSLACMCVWDNNQLDYTGAETREMALETGIALPEVLCDEDVKSWFKYFGVCARANGWNDEKKLRGVSTLLHGCT